MHANPEAPASTPSPDPGYICDLDTIVEFLRPTPHPVSRITAWRWVKQDGLRNYGTGKQIRVSIADFLDAHAARHHPL